MLSGYKVSVDRFESAGKKQDHELSKLINPLFRTRTHTEEKVLEGESQLSKAAAVSAQEKKRHL